MRIVKSYSQNREDEIIAGLLAEGPGTVLDIGAHDGEFCSNSLAFFEAGWHGVFVEPSPAPLSRLVQRYGREERATVIGAIVKATEGSGVALFWDSLGDGVSTIDPVHRNKWSAGNRVKFAEVILPTLPIDWVFGNISAMFPPLRLLSIDVEGKGNLDLLSRFADIREGEPGTAAGEYATRRAREVEAVIVEREEGQASVTAIAGVLARIGFEIVVITSENVVARKAQ